MAPRKEDSLLANWKCLLAAVLVSLSPFQYGIDFSAIGGLQGMYTHWMTSQSTITDSGSHGRIPPGLRLQRSNDANRIQYHRRATAAHRVADDPWSDGIGGDGRSPSPVPGPQGLPLAGMLDHLRG